MKMVKLLSTGLYGKKGQTVQVSDELAKRLVEDNAAKVVVERNARARPDNKALSAPV